MRQSRLQSRLHSPCILPYLFMLPIFSSFNVQSACPVILPGFLSSTQQASPLGFMVAELWYLSCTSLTQLGASILLSCGGDERHLPHQLFQINISLPPWGIGEACIKSNIIKSRSRMIYPPSTIRARTASLDICVLYHEPRP